MEGTDSWYAEQIAKCQAALRRQEETLDAIRRAAPRPQSSTPQREHTVAPAAKAALKLFPEMLSPTDTVQLVQDVMRRSLPSDSDGGGDAPVAKIADPRFDHVDIARSGRSLSTGDDTGDQQVEKA